MLPAPCRYGENPHQKAAFYKDESLREAASGGVAKSTVHWGKEMSYNNYLVGSGQVKECGSLLLFCTERRKQDARLWEVG